MAKKNKDKKSFASRKDCSGMYFGINPENAEQKALIDFMFEREKKCIVGTGGYGTGKSVAAFAAGLELVYKGDYDFLYYIRTLVPIKDKDRLGTLPGGYEQKISPYMGAFECKREFFFDLVDEPRKNLLHNDVSIKQIETSLLRGVDFNRSVIIADDFQNFTRSDMEVVLSRIGNDSIFCAIGDPNQCDLRLQKGESDGLSCLIDLFENVANEQERSIYAHVHMKEVLRSEVVAIFVELLRRQKAMKQKE